MLMFIVSFSLFYLLGNTLTSYNVPFGSCHVTFHSLWPSNHMQDRLIYRPFGQQILASVHGFDT